MYYHSNPANPGFESFYISLILAIATIGISMSGVFLSSLYITFSGSIFMLISIFKHHIYEYNQYLFIKSITYVVIGSGLFIITAIIIEKFSYKLFCTQMRIRKERDDISTEKEKFKKLNIKKDKLFSIISHDLRSPFNSLLGYFGIILKDESEKIEVNRNDIQQIYLQTRRTYNLLNNLLSWSNSQLSKKSFSPQLHIAQDVILENHTLFTEIALQKGILLEYHVPENLTIFCDKEMIMAILRNLIFNAIKFTSPGGEINVTCKDVQNNKVEIAVSDSGVGIDNSDINKILNTSEYYSTKGTSNEEGSGIGLMICQEFLQKNHSTLKIKSKKNEGSTFYFNIQKSAFNDRY
jgi:signal transduction histidine kinase